MFGRVLENTYTEGTDISVDTQQNGHPEAGRADDVVARAGLDDPARDPLAEIAPFEVQLETRVDSGARDGVESPCCDEGLVEEPVFFHVPWVGGLLLPGHLSLVSRHTPAVELLWEPVAKGGEQVEVSVAGGEDTDGLAPLVAWGEDPDVLASLSDGRGVLRPNNLLPRLDLPVAIEDLAHEGVDLWHEILHRGAGQPGVDAVETHVLHITDQGCRVAGSNLQCRG